MKILTIAILSLFFIVIGTATTFDSQLPPHRNNVTGLCGNLGWLKNSRPSRQVSTCWWSFGDAYVDDRNFNLTAILRRPDDQNRKPIYAGSIWSRSVIQPLFYF